MINVKLRREQRYKALSLVVAGEMVFGEKVRVNVRLKAETILLLTSA